MANTRRNTSSFYRGEEGRERAEEELAKQKQRAEARREAGNMPFRFRVHVGETTQFVILDDAPDFFRHEHNLLNPQTKFWDTFTGCTREEDNCPVCEATARDPYYALYLSVLDFTPFKTKDGTKHEFSRKLLVVKPAQQKKFIRAYHKAEKEGRTLRGALFEASRDGDKDSAIGNDIEFVEYMEEDELTTYVRSWKDKDGKKQTEDCSEPYIYEDLFEEPDSDKLRALVGGSPTIGSREYERKALGTGARRAPATQDDDPPPRGARRGRTNAVEERPARAPARSRRGVVEDEVDDDEVVPVTRTRGSARTGRQAAEQEAPVRTRRGRPSVDDVPEDEDEPPVRRGSRRPAAIDPDDDDELDAPPPGVGRRLPVRGRR